MPSIGTKDTVLNSACIAIGSFGSLDWNVGVYAALSSVSRLAVSVRDRANVLTIAYTLHKVNRNLAEFFKVVDAAMEGRAKQDPDAKPVTVEDVKTMGYNLLRLHATMAQNYSGMARVGLLNNSLTAGSMQKFKGYRERILDLADWVEAVQLQEYVNEVFDRAKDEKERGELFDLAQVE